jgi:hypothetical protein
MITVIAQLVAAYVAISVALAAFNAAWKLSKRLGKLSIEFASVGGEAFAVMASWPFEIALDQAHRLVAIAAELHAQWKIWRSEFRGKMSWAEFRRKMSGQKEPQRDDYADALDMLDLDEPFSRQDMDARFRRIIQGVHPDKGGSEYLFKQVDAARNLILKRKGWKK